MAMLVVVAVTSSSAEAVAGGMPAHISVIDRASFLIIVALLKRVRAVGAQA